MTRDTTTGMYRGHPGGVGSVGAAGAEESAAAAKRRGAELWSSLIRVTLAAGWCVSLLAPIGGLLVFWWLPFKPAVTVYAAIVAVGMVLRSVVEQARMRREINEIARRQVHDYDAR